ncbi:MAG: ribosome biogenesis GTPase Der [Bacilli bacterium]|nr:ribosome biogenesis GTPase Der [Bacilli bacterium]
MRKTVCLVGRPNTGKSSLFNRMVMQNKAIISDTAGTTRDRLYGVCYHNDKSFTVIDTGGIDLENADFNTNIRMQAELAIDEADVIVFVVDGKEDLTQNDYEVRNMLMRTDKKVIVAVNKIDNPEREENIYNFYELGFEHIVTISVEHKRHITELLDLITEDFPPYSTEPRDSVCRFSLIGRPNVGKSSLVNAILGEERQIVSNVEGTTRDASDSRFTYNHEDYIVVDTAGIRKRGKIYEELEKYSIIRGFRAIERSDVCCVVIDAEAGIIEQDKHIVQYALENNKAIVLVVNKWDTVKNKDQALKEWKLKIQNEFQFIPYVRTVFLSAKEKPKVPELMDAIIKAYESFTKEVKTSTINDIIRDAYALHMAPSYKKNRLKIFFVNQTDICPPRFTFNVNNKNLVHFSYQRYLENKIRENIDLEGTPIVIQFKNKSE